MSLFLGFWSFGSLRNDCVLVTVEQERLVLVWVVVWNFAASQSCAQHLRDVKRIRHWCTSLLTMATFLSLHVWECRQRGNYLVLRRRILELLRYRRNHLRVGVAWPFSGFSDFMAHGTVQLRSNTFCTNTNHSLLLAYVGVKLFHRKDKQQAVLSQRYRE